MNLKEKVEELYSKINSAQRKSGLNHQVEIVGVTKTRPFSYIEESYVAGLRHIGENRIQEAESKFGSFNNMPNLKKRFIGCAKRIILGKHQLIKEQGLTGDVHIALIKKSDMVMI